MDGFITRLTRAGLRHPWRFLACALALSGVSIWLASSLEIRSSFEELLPSDLPSVRNVKELMRRVGGDGTVLVSVEVLDGGSLASAEAMAPVLAGDFQAMGRDTVRAVEWNLNPVEAYYQAHWPMFLSVDQLQQGYAALDQEVEKRKRSALSLDLGLDEPAPDAGAAAPAADGGLAALMSPGAPTPRERIAARFAKHRDGLFIHPDGRSLTILVRPTGTSLGVHEARKLLDAMHAIIDRHRDELAAKRLRVGLGGTFPLFVAEYEAIIHDVGSTAALCVSLVLVALLLFFRDLRSTFSVGAAALLAVAVTFGVTRLVIGYLNTQTAFLGSIVVGNGINYGLIYLARVRQLRRAGVPLEPAVIEGANVAAHATLLASAASSVSFGMLILAANRGFRHFGFIGGVGMLLCWCFTFALLPPLLALCERVRPVRPAKSARPALRIAPGWMRALFAHPKRIVWVFGVLMAVAVALFVRQLPVAIETNVQHLTNKLEGPATARLQRDNHRANEALGESSAGAIALLPSREAADAFCDVVDHRTETEPRYAKVIESCDTLSSVLPMHQDEKLALIHKLHDRLTEAVLEALPKREAAKLREVKRELGAQRRIEVADVPPNLIDHFRERDGSLGRLAVVTARADAKLELAPNLEAFAEGVRNVPVQGRTYDATGENVVFADLIQNIETEGPLTTVGSLVGVCILVAVFFRRLRSSLEVLIALIGGVLLMGGAAAALKLKINFFNFIVFPITFGIAVDYGANVVGRIRDRGGRVLDALAEVGPAVALCSCTSMIGYGSLVTALNRALQSFGWYALVGEVTSIATALVLLPAMALLVNPGKDAR